MLVHNHKDLKLESSSHKNKIRWSRSVQQFCFRFGARQKNKSPVPFIQEENTYKPYHLSFRNYKFPRNNTNFWLLEQNLIRPEDVVVHFLYTVHWFLRFSGMKPVIS